MKPTLVARALRAAVMLVLVILAGEVLASPAQAAAFRYWGYWHLEKGAWAFAQTGAAQVVPMDGSVEGWRFAVGQENSIRDPRVTPAFDALCAGTPITAGSKRIGLVLDYGRPADSADGAAPPAARATCVTVPDRATGADVLAAGATLRLDKGQTCGIDGWPATGCGLPVDPVSPAAASPDTDITLAAPVASASASPAARSTDNRSTSSGGLPLAGLGVLAAVLLIAALGFAAWRRGREASDG